MSTKTKQVLKDVKIKVKGKDSILIAMLHVDEKPFTGFTTYTGVAYSEVGAALLRFADIVEVFNEGVLIETHRVHAVSPVRPDGNWYSYVFNTHLVTKDNTYATW